MDQKKLWKQKWIVEDRFTPNDFAKKSFSGIKKRSLKTLLDIGCGVGIDSVFFAQKGLRVTAVDFSESGIEKLNQSIKDKKIKTIIPVLSDITNLKFSPSSFDVIYAHLSLQYFDNRTTTKIFNKLYEILYPKGLFFIKCKSTDDRRYGKGKEIEKDMYKLKGHNRHFFSKEYMAEKLKKFKILKIETTSSTYKENRSSFIEAVAAK